MNRMTRGVASLGLALAAFAWADDAPLADAGAQQVEVTGTRDPELKSYRHMLAGLDAFEKHHSLAPKADLRFLLRPQQPDVSLEGIRLSITGKDTDIDLPVDAQGMFSLPRSQPAADEDAAMVVNRKKGSFRWAPSVHSPGVPEGARRLGDLRLECEVRWGVEYEELPFMMRNLFRLAGGPCNSSHISVNFPAPPGAESFTMLRGDKMLTKPVVKDKAGRAFFTPPLDDDWWPDDQMVVFNRKADDKAGT